MAAKNVHSAPIKLTNVRLSFPRLKEPVKFDENNPNEIPKYKASFLLDPNDPAHAKTIEEIKAAAKKCIIDAWGQKPKTMKPIECFGDGDTQINKKTEEVYDGYAGMFYVSAANARRPLLQDRNGEQVDRDRVEEVFYGGCYVNASIDLWIQDNDFGKALRCQLRGVRFRRDGEAFGGGGVSEDELADDDEDFGDSNAKTKAGDDIDDYFNL